MVKPKKLVIMLAADWMHSTSLPGIQIGRRRIINVRMSFPVQKHTITGDIKKSYI